MKQILQQQHRDPRKNKILFLIFLEAPFLRGFYFAKNQPEILMRSQRSPFLRKRD
jgi:hypothetical protein